MSRNQDRLGGVQQRDASPPPSGGGLSFVVPTEFVDLPSLGRYYPEGHPLHGEETIEIRQMTAKEEDILTSTTLLKKGIALDKVIENIIVNKQIDPKKLLIGDRNAIIIAARVSGYGSDYNVTLTCPNCGNKDKTNFDLNCASINKADEYTDYSVEYVGDGIFSTVLHKLQNVEVQFRLLNGADEKELTKGVKTGDKFVTNQLHKIIHSVNGDTSTETIRSLIENLPMIDARLIRAAYKAVNPNIELNYNFTCSNCSHEQELEVPITAGFFWPDE